ncbi:conserved hypothetical protein [Beutenbergia cavernae DSM 12333]|uniref:Uncharacterized protein n=1 Tax=Beutenbergia cavernae (strain ATCC BAA-8 / DSM 12333 / CCUG 43141 / JCM 11478 / NBRC 16432 / NCIMB 13614 / HKI 0122) TaxID=471853 RepID=C5C1C7_BEUC1|nr:hypothetical protein [Beutenbergia cavernae]ACQ81537.1 conserved hypothetical protein [Beutenbergia cavernae DSM 12333]
MRGDDENTGRQASARVWREVAPGTRELLEAGLGAADVRTLLQDVTAARAHATRPADVVARWQQDRFVRPATSDPRRVAALEARLWDLVPDDVAGVELSPVAPLGTAVAVGPVSERRIVTTTRLTEVVSDSTNVLAVEAAARRSGAPRGEQVHLAAIHRQLRAQDFGPGAASHFRLLALVSSARDTGSGRTEAGLLTRHVRVWQTMLGSTIPHRRPRIEFTVLGDDAVVAERWRDAVLPAVADGEVPVVEDASRERGRGYYTGVALRLVADDGAAEIGDGGLTTWTAQLLGDRKERCLVSCLATERLAELATD